jgi:uncharacterized protein YodC (DUF2158 family)
VCPPSGPRAALEDIGNRRSAVTVGIAKGSEVTEDTDTTDDQIFKVGDVVCFKSGGHPMTVIAIDQSSVSCVWSVKGDAKTKSYPAEALKITEVSPATLEELVLASIKLRQEGDDR